MSSQPAGGVADVGPRQTYDALATDQAAQIVDVRSRPEWSFVGIADLGALGREPILIEWQSWPDMAVQADFLHRLDAALQAKGLDRETPLYFLCRSGVRSHAAARAAQAAGYAHTFNIAGGFEGPPDGDRHRGQVGGWKAEGLPWIQS
jgi:rhodanese-related sulfurtransferase